MRGLLLFFLAFLTYGWLTNTPAGLLGKADAVGYAVCHRIDLRTFHLGERPIPLCARCSGMYLGAVLGLIFQMARGRRRSGFPPGRVTLVLGLLTAAFFMDGLNSYLHFFPGVPTAYTPQNWLRLVTGTGMGIVIAGILVPAFNQTVWERWDPRSLIGDLKTMGILLALGAILDLVILTENPIVLYPLAILSAVGVLLVLVLLYAMIWVLIVRQENRFLTWVELGVPITSGLVMALLQIAVIDFGRFWLTGTWGGFQF